MKKTKGPKSHDTVPFRYNSSSGGSVTVEVGIVVNIERLKFKNTKKFKLPEIVRNSAETKTLRNSAEFRGIQQHSVTRNSV
jgi:hypothetical protein